MLNRTRYKVIFEDEPYRITSEVTEYRLLGVLLFREKREVSRRGSEITPYQRECVRRLDGSECVYCAWTNRPYHLERMKAKKPRLFGLDHIFPQVQGGPTHLWNLAYACRECNSQKGGRTPDEAGMVLRFGRFHHTAYDVMLPMCRRDFEARSYSQSYVDYVASFNYGEPFNSEFLALDGCIPYVHPRDTVSYSARWRASALAQQREMLEALDIKK